METVIGLSNFGMKLTFSVGEKLTRSSPAGRAQL